MREGIMTEMSRREASAEHTPHAFQSGRPKSVGKFMPGQKFANFLTGHKSPAEREMYFLVFHFCSFLVCALSAFLTFNITNFALLAVLEMCGRIERGEREEVSWLSCIYIHRTLSAEVPRGAKPQMIITRSLFSTWRNVSWLAWMLLAQNDEYASSNWTSCVLTAKYVCLLVSAPKWSVFCLH